MAQISGDVDRPRIRAGLMVICCVLGIPAVVLTVVRMLPFGLPTPFVQLISFAPYLLLPLTLAMVAVFSVRWRVAGTLLILAMLAQLLWLVPAGTGRSVNDGAEVSTTSGPAAPERLDVMALNALYGNAEAVPVVETVRQEGVDVLVIVEFSADLAQRLESAGLENELPYSERRPEQGPGGSAIYARFPVEDVREISGTTFSMQIVTVPVPVASGPAVPVQVTAVHAYPPFPGGVDKWRDDLEALADKYDDGRLQVFAGDFNATIDHAQFRQLLAGGGLFDAAAVAGSRLHPTWPVHRLVPTMLTLDHILASNDFGLADYQVRILP